MRCATLVSILSLLAACAGTRVEEGLLESPYTAAEIRSANPAGTEIRFRIRTSAGPSGIQVLRFVETDADGALVESLMLSEDGTRSIPSAGPVASTWEELRGHASFPNAIAVRTRADCVVPAGKFEGWLYTVLGETDGEVSRYYFADDLAGPPVKLETSIDGERVLSMELVERTSPAR